MIEQLWRGLAAGRVRDEPREGEEHHLEVCEGKAQVANCYVLDARSLARVVGPKGLATSAMLVRRRELSLLDRPDDIVLS